MIFKNMISIKRGISYIIHNRALFCDSVVKHFFGWLPDKLYLSLRYRFNMGRWINWKKPRTFTEKIQWLKVYNRRPEYTIMVDKYAVKKYVADRIGEKYIIPTLGVWESPEDIDWNSLPDQFVLKTTHGGGSGGVVVCKDKETFNNGDAIAQLNGSMEENIYRNFREWPYKDVQKRIIAEKFMTPHDKSDDFSFDLTDYKFFCFNGVPKYCQVIRDRHSKETIDFYDMDWAHQDFVGLNPVARPSRLREIKNICMRLAKGIPFVRIDLYVVDDNVYFGEITFFPASGIGAFSPNCWNEKLGSLIHL